MAALLGPVPPKFASRLREMGYTPPPPRGSPTRSLELCLDGSTGDHEVRAEPNQIKSNQTSFVFTCLYLCKEVSYMYNNVIFSGCSGAALFEE